MIEKYYVQIKGVRPLLMHAPNGLGNNPDVVANTPHRRRRSRPHFTKILKETL